MPTTRRTTIEPVRNTEGQCVGYYEHTDTLTPIRLVKGKLVDPPPRPALRTHTKTTPPRTKVKAAPARRSAAPAAPKVYHNRRLRRYFTETHCLACQRTHQACQCLPRFDLSPAQLAAATVAAPIPEIDSFHEIVRRQRELGMLPGGTSTPPAGQQEHRTLHAAQGQQGGVPEATNLLQRVVDRQRQLGLR